MNSNKTIEQKFTGLEIAIVGVSCRFPNSDDIEKYWDNCLQGKDCISRFSDEVLASNGVPREQYSNEKYVNAKGVINNPLSFDADFFNYNKREAEYLEPQIRKLHECGFEALGSAGIVPSTHTESVGCYLASSAQLGWQMAAYEECERDGASLFSAFNLVEKDFAATRLAYKLGLTGPAIAVQTACSSSLTAIHLASRALLLGECQMALVAAATLVTPNRQGYLFQEGMITSPDGVCRPFDSLANGTVGGEGIGAVVLQPLKMALQQKRPVLAIIKGSALNNDGDSKMGYTAPSIDGQSDVIRRALRTAKVEPQTIGYIEAHGTATALGDPIEIQALRDVFAEAGEQTIGIGSVKSIIGHLDSAAGMAGIIKAALMLKHKKICANPYFHMPNPKTKLSSSPFYMNTKSKEWESTMIRRAGVSSFGIGGTNSHVILEEFVECVQEESEEVTPTLLPLSAKSAGSLEEMEKRLTSKLELHQEPLSDVAWTLQQGREHFSHRSVLLCADNNFHASKVEFTRGICLPSERKVVFTFPGQGSQYLGMGRDLYLREKVFRSHVEHCLELMDAEDATLVRSYFIDIESGYSFDSVVVQLAIFTISYSISELLKSKGIVPDMLLGHSLGEYVAATVSGVFSLEDALFLVSTRAKLMATMSSGAMLSVSLSEKQAAEFLHGSIEVAALNGKTVTVLAGSLEDIEALETRLEQKNIHSRRLKTLHAFHSSTIDEIQPEFANALDSIDFNDPSIPILSNLTGCFHSGSEIKKPAYWLAHQRQKVDFLSCMETLASSEKSLVFIEVGPGNTLTSCVQKFFYESKGETTLAINMIRHPSLSEGDISSFYKQLAKLWCAAGIGEWSKIGVESGNFVHLPVYAFSEKEYSQIRDRMVSRNDSVRYRESTQKNDKAKLYHPVWYRQCQRKTVASSIPKNLVVITSKRAVEEYAQQISHLASRNNIVLIDDEKELKLSGLKDSYTFLLIPHYSDFDGNPLVHYQKWLSCIRQLTANEAIRASRFILVTPQIENVLGHEVNNERICLLKGLVQSLPYEYPEHSCYQIDVEYESLSNSDVVLAFSTCLTEVNQSSRVAIRNNQIWLPDFRTVEQETDCNQSNIDLRHGGLVAITGGTGGVALQLSQSLAKRYAARIVLLSRAVLPEREMWQRIKDENENINLVKIIKDIEAIEKLGGTVILRSCDVSDKETLFQALEGVEEEFGQIDMLIHSAASDRGALIAQPDETLHYDIMSAKVIGAQNLIEFFKGRSLKTMLLCSSLISYSGAQGQSAYVAANNFLDGLAERRDLPFSIKSIAWDRWLEVGMAAKNMKIDHLTMGLTNKHGQEAFLQALALEWSQLLVSASDIEKRRAEARKTQVENSPQSKEISLRGAVIEAVSHQLGLVDPDENTSFFALGATSLDLVQINEKLKQRLQCELPISTMFTYSSILKLYMEMGRRLTQQTNGPVNESKRGARSLAKQRASRRIKKTV
ncbi:type I polyketide synthase [Vibrio proteolyticus]